MLDIECFTYLNRALESAISPIVILASNRGYTTIRGTSTDTSTSTSTVGGISAAHGIPPDLLARLLIIPTNSYTSPEIRSIITLRARTEGLPPLTDAALDRVAHHGVTVSLRYALQLLTPASILARVHGGGGGGGRAVGTGTGVGLEIGVEEVRECEELFLDARRSAALIIAGERRKGEGEGEGEGEGGVGGEYIIA